MLFVSNRVRFQRVEVLDLLASAAVLKPELLPFRQRAYASQMNEPNTSNGTANEINEKCSPAAHTWAQRGYVQVPPGTEHLRSPSVPRMMRMKSEVCGSDLFLDTYRYEVSTKTHLHCISHKTTISSAAHNSRQSNLCPAERNPEETRGPVSPGLCTAGRSGAAERGSPTSV